MAELRLVKDNEIYSSERKSFNIGKVVKPAALFAGGFLLCLVIMLSSQRGAGDFGGEAFILPALALMLYVFWDMGRSTGRKEGRHELRSTEAKAKKERRYQPRVKIESSAQRRGYSSCQCGRRSA